MKLKQEDHEFKVSLVHWEGNWVNSIGRKKKSQLMNSLSELGFHRLYKPRGEVSQQVFSQGLSQESSLLELLPLLYAFHTGSTDKNSFY